MTWSIQNVDIKRSSLDWDMISRLPIKIFCLWSLFFSSHADKELSQSETVKQNVSIRRQKLRFKHNNFNPQQWHYAGLLLGTALCIVSQLESVCVFTKPERCNLSLLTILVQLVYCPSQLVYPAPQWPHSQIFTFSNKLNKAAQTDWWWRPEPCLGASAVRKINLSDISCFQSTCSAS